MGPTTTNNIMNTPARSTALLRRCCKGSTSGLRQSSLAIAGAAPSSSTVEQVQPFSSSATPSYPSTSMKASEKSRHKTPKGTNTKPGPRGRPNRYDTTYGIPPLHPALQRKGAEKLDRNAFEAAQRPDYAAIWKLEDEISTTTNEGKKGQAMEQLQRLRQNHPWRHPLWAFFHEKNRAEHEEELREKPTHPGANSLAYSLETPNKAEGTSGRAWHAEELRRKSFDDLHKLWYLLAIERNALYTQRDEGKRQGVAWQEYTHISEKLHRCRKSMARIKYVLHERRTAALEAQAILRASQAGQVQDGFSEGAVQEPVRPAKSFMEAETEAVPLEAERVRA